MDKQADSTKKPWCAAMVHGPRVQVWQCCRAASVQRDGKWYCRTHDPEAVAARRKASDDKWRREQAERDRDYEDCRAVARRLGHGTAWRSNNGIGKGVLIQYDAALQLAEKLETLQALAAVDPVNRATTG